MFGVNLAETCKGGHPWKPETTYSYEKRKRCKICATSMAKERYKKNKNKAKEEK